MSRTDEMLNLWFEENVRSWAIEMTGGHVPAAEDLTASFRDYFSVRLRDVLPPHPISQNLERLRDRETITRVVEETPYSQEENKNV